MRRALSRVTRSCFALGGATLLVACGARAPAAKAPVPPSAVTPAKPATATEKLLAALRAVERPRPLLELLAEPALAVLDTRLQTLTPEQREQLLSGELGEVMPLLHLRAGGGSARALFALSTTPAASQELPLVFEVPVSGTDQERQRVVQLAHDLAQRAALHFLRDRVIDVSGAKRGAASPLLAAIEQAARSAERPDLVRLALEALAETETAPEVWVRLGQARAFDRDVAGVRAAQERLPQGAPEQAQLTAVLSAAQAASGTDPLATSWALLQLGRYADAGQQLAPMAARAKSDLRVAAALAVVAADGSACPGLQEGVGSPRLCALAVQARPQLARALSELEQAWQSKAGRNAASVEAYLGLAHVVPWLMDLSTATDPASLERDFAKRHSALTRAIADLPEQRPLAVFAAAFAAGMKAGLQARPGERPRIESSQKPELVQAALSTEAAAPRLAVAAVLASDQSVLSLLPEKAPQRLAGTRAGLLVWEAASSSDAATLETARSALAERISSAPTAGTERPAAVLLLAELDAAATPGERSYGALAQVASQLISEPLPPELALRAVLDAAGALERLGRASDALGVLKKAAEIESLPGPAGDLLSLIRAEKLVLEWDAKRDPERKALAKQLAALRSPSSPPPLAFAFDAWSNAKPLRQGKKKPKELLEERLGVRAADSMTRGSLRATRVSLGLAYKFQAGVTPEVMFEPMLVPLVRLDLIQKAL